jgi:hypothetical protein
VQSIPNLLLPTAMDIQAIKKYKGEDDTTSPLTAEKKVPSRLPAGCQQVASKLLVRHTNAS